MGKEKFELITLLKEREKRWLFSLLKLLGAARMCKCHSHNYRLLAESWAQMQQQNMACCYEHEAQACTLPPPTPKNLQAGQEDGKLLSLFVTNHNYPLGASPWKIEVCSVS